MSRPETYGDVVWRQFQKDRAAVWSAWLFVPAFLAAVFAPALASNIPYYLFDGKEIVYPWWRALFHAPEGVDYVFNMALVMFVPWLVVGLITAVTLADSEAPTRSILWWLAVEFLVLTGAASAYFAFPENRPAYPYHARNFPEDEMSNRKSYSLYPLIPFGPTEQDLSGGVNLPPRFPFGPSEGAAKERKLWKEVNDGFPHWLGTDDIGRDVLTRMIYGMRISMTVGFVAVGIYISIGIVAGAVAGYFGGWVDMLVSRVIEVVLLFPTFFLIMALVALLEKHEAWFPRLYVMMVVIGLTSWPGVARLIRGEVLKQRSAEYVTAARSMGASHFRIIFRHVIPNALTPALVAAPFGIAGAIALEAALSLLGFGVRPPAPSWGSILRQGMSNYSYWWLILYPSLSIFATVTMFNLVGNGVRDAMDPRLRK